MFSKIFNRKQLMILLLGFTSGLPLALTGTSLQAWLTTENVDIKTIGFFSLVGLPYTFKFLWAPLMDRFELPFLSRRKGWLLITQLLLSLSLFFISFFQPSTDTQIMAFAALIIAFLSASQDIVIDAYRTDVLEQNERGLGSSLSVFGYRLAMILSGGIAFVWADHVSGSGMSWGKIYQIMAMIMLAFAVVTLTILPRVPCQIKAPTSSAKNDLIGFFAVCAAVFFGYQFTIRLAQPFSESILSPLFSETTDGSHLIQIKKWADILSLFIGIAFTLPLAWWSSKKAKFETLNTSLANYFQLKGAIAFLALIILYKLGDSFAGSLTTPFLLKGVGFAQAEIGVINKVIGIWITIIGAIIGGSLMLKMGLWWSLLTFGLLQMFSNLGFWMVAHLGKNAWGSFTLPSFDFMIVSLKETSQVDRLLLFGVGVENITGGMGTAAFVAFLMALCNQKFTATQYALLTALASVGRVWVGPVAGTLVDSIGWQNFYLFST